MFMANSLPFLKRSGVRKSEWFTLPNVYKFYIQNILINDYEADTLTT